MSAYHFEFAMQGSRGDDVVTLRLDASDIRSAWERARQEAQRLAPGRRIRMELRMVDSRYLARVLLPDAA